MYCINDSLSLLQSIDPRHSLFETSICPCHPTNILLMIVYLHMQAMHVIKFRPFNCLCHQIFASNIQAFYINQIFLQTTSSSMLVTSFCLQNIVFIKRFPPQHAGYLSSNHNSISASRKKIIFLFIFCIWSVHHWLLADFFQYYFELVNIF